MSQSEILSYLKEIGKAVTRKEIEQDLTHLGKTTIISNLCRLKKNDEIVWFYDRITNSMGYPYRCVKYKYKNER
jgi:hypothetical protein